MLLLSNKKKGRERKRTRGGREETSREGGQEGKTGDYSAITANCCKGRVFDFIYGQMLSLKVEIDEAVSDVSD